MKKMQKETFVKQVLLVTKKKEQLNLCSTSTDLLDNLKKNLSVWVNRHNLALSKEWFVALTEKCYPTTTKTIEWQSISLDDLCNLKHGDVISFSKDVSLTKNGKIKTTIVVVLAFEESGLKYRMGGKFCKMNASNYSNYFWLLKISEEEKKKQYWKNQDVLSSMKKIYIR
jgi:hypothetical protein